MESQYPAWLCLATGAITALALTAPWSRWAVKSGLLGSDRYKPGQPELPTAGGVVVLTGFLVAAATMLVLGELSATEGAIVVTVLLFGLFGLADDLRQNGFPQRIKVLLPLLLGLPVALSIPTDSIPGWLDRAPFALVVVLACLYLTATANLHNMHAGYNGLSCGLAALLLAGLTARMVLDGQTQRLPLTAALLGATLALLWSNRYPARILEGDVGTYLWGAAVGSFLLIEGWPLLGLVMLAPHILDLLLWAWARFKGLPFVKFGKLDDDGTIIAPYPYKLKFAIVHGRRLSESQAVLALWGLSALAITITLVLPGG